MIHFIYFSDYSTDDAFKVHLRVSETTQVLVGVYLTRCEFFNEGNEEWDNEGCLPHQDSIATCIKCACNHMTSFGGSLFVSPDELDFTDLSVSKLVYENVFLKFKFKTVRVCKIAFY
jgi:hypothetical protein